MEGLDVVLFVANDHAWATERFVARSLYCSSVHILVDFAEYVRRTPNGVIAPNVSDVFLKAYFQVCVSFVLHTTGCMYCI